MKEYEKALVAYKNGDFKAALRLLGNDDIFSDKCDEISAKRLILRINALCNLGQNEKALETGLHLLTFCKDNAQIYLKIASIASSDALALMLLASAYELILKMPDDKQKFIFLMQFYMLKSMREFFVGQRENALKNALSAKAIADKFDLKDEGLFDALGCALSANNHYEEAINAFLEGFERFHTRTFALKLHDTIMRVDAPKELKLQALALYEQRFEPSDTLLAFEKAGRDKNIFKNKRILVIEKQGLGDTIMYLRYLPQLLELGANVALSVSKPLKRLLETHFKIADESFKPDFTISFCSLPFYLQNAQIPEPFSFKKRENSSFSKIGIFWKTTAHNRANANAFDNGLNKSFELGSLLDCFGKNAQIFSFQIDANEKEKMLLKERGILDLSPNIKDFADTLDELLKIDLLVCCDTAIAHLAGGIGIKVIVLLPNNFDWRWGRFDEKKSPWYPQITCIASDKKDDFTSAFDELKKYLKALEF